MDGAAAEVLRRLDRIETGASMLLSELDDIDIRLHRAFTAVSIDNWVAYLNVERNRMLEDERQARKTAGLTKPAALGIYGLVSLSMRQKPDWKGAAGSIFAAQPFEDVRVAVGLDNTKLVNVSAMARGRGLMVGQVIGHLEGEGYRMLSWSEFIAKADSLRRAALRGEAGRLRIEEGALQDMQVLAAD